MLFGCKRAMNNIALNNTKFTKKYSMIMNFVDDKSRETAVTKLNGVPKISTRVVEKIWLKIMICNVINEENQDKTGNKAQ